MGIIFLPTSETIYEKLDEKLHRTVFQERLTVFEILYPRFTRACHRSFPHRHGI